MINLDQQQQPRQMPAAMGQQPSAMPQAAAVVPPALFRQQQTPGQEIPGQMPPPGQSPGAGQMRPPADAGGVPQQGQGQGPQVNPIIQQFEAESKKLMELNSIISDQEERLRSLRRYMGKPAGDEGQSVAANSLYGKSVQGK